MAYQTTYVPKETNHTFHLVMTVLTCCAWAPVWLCVALWNMATKRKHTTVVVGPQMPPRAIAVPGSAPGVVYPPPMLHASDVRLRPMRVNRFAADYPRPCICGQWCADEAQYVNHPHILPPAQ